MQTLNRQESISNFRSLHELAPIKSRTIEETGRFQATGGQDDHRAVEFLNSVFENAIDASASDIHFEAHDIDGMKARLRIGNDMVNLEQTIAARDAPFAKAKLCAKTSLNYQERLIPQDGRMMFYYASRRFDVRVAITPTVTGYKVVCRLLDSGNSNIFMDLLDMPFLIKDCMKRVASQNEGVFLMSGPTGSGKTTTLYAILQYLNTDTRHIITIENPVEYVIDQFTQIEVNGNLTFSHAMRAALRLDPDVIMVGEIRDGESANIALQAGSTGHMMLSTVHANSAAATLTRLESLGLKNPEIAAVLSAMVAQRLVKSIPDPNDIVWEKPNDIEREWLVKHNLYSDSHLFPRVDRKKMGGRVAMVEMIEMTPKIRSLLESGNLINNLLSSIIEEAVGQPQFETLAQAGMRLALEGKTTLAEVIQAAADIGYIPKRKRFEQILLQQGQIQIDVLDGLQKELAQTRALGRIIHLESEIVSRGICTLETVQQAIHMSAALDT